MEHRKEPAQEDEGRRRKLRGEEKIDDTIAVFFPSESRIQNREEIEGVLRGGDSSRMIPPASELDHSNGGDKNNDDRKKRKVDGNNGVGKYSKNYDGQDPDPCLHGWVGAIRKMGGSEPIWFCTKDLTPTDLDPNQNRLLLPNPNMKKLLGDFLTERERSELGCGGVKAVIVDEMGRCWDSRLNHWASKNYNLNGSSWRKLVNRCELSEEHALKVGAFRYRSSDQADDDQEKSLGFVLLVQRKVCNKKAVVVERKIRKKNAVAVELNKKADYECNYYYWI